MAGGVVKPKAACVRCGETLRDASEPCGFCQQERMRDAATKLVAASKATSNAALVTRVDAIDTLRRLGFSQAVVLQARANAVDGCSVEEILDRLLGVGEAVPVGR